MSRNYRTQMTPAEFAGLPPDTLVTSREFLSTADKRGYLPIGSTGWKAGVAAGDYPKGRTMGRVHVWRQADIVALARRLGGADEAASA